MSKKKLNENYVDLQPINQWESAPEETYETKFKAFLAEQAAEAKTTSKEVEEIQSHAYDQGDKNNINNMNGQEFQNGVYYEAKNQPTKNLEEVREEVAKNLAKDPLHYVKEGQFGEKGVGYVEPVQEEVTGDYAASGYSAKLKKVVKESLMGGTVVTAGNPNSFASQQAKVINSMMAELEEGFGDSEPGSYANKQRDNSSKTKNEEDIYDEYMPMDEDARTDAEEEGYLDGMRDEKSDMGENARTDAEEEGYLDGMRDEKYDMSEELEEEKAKDEVKTKSGKVKKESVTQALSRIERVGTGVALEAKIKAIDEEISRRNEQLTMLDENEAMSELMDKGKLKELRTEVKILEKSKAKYDKMYEKATGNKRVEVEIVDETEI